MHRIDLNRWKHTEVYCIRHFNENSFQTRSPTARCCLCRCCCSTHTKPKHWLQKKIPSQPNRHDEIKLSVFACLLLLLKSFCFSLGLSFGYISCLLQLLFAFSLQQPTSVFGLNSTNKLQPCSKDCTHLINTLQPENRYTFSHIRYRKIDRQLLFTQSILHAIECECLYQCPMAEYCNAKINDYERFSTTMNQMKSNTMYDHFHSSCVFIFQPENVQIFLGNSIGERNIPL